MAAFWALVGVSWRAFWGVLQGISSSNPPLLDPIAAWAWIELFQDLLGFLRGFFGLHHQEFGGAGDAKFLGIPHSQRPQILAISDSPLEIPKFLKIRLRQQLKAPNPFPSG